MRQIAVITPYAQFSFAYRSEDGKHDFSLAFKRRTDVMPPPPGETRHHPSSVDLELVKRLAGATKCSTMVQFLRREFDCVTAELAGGGMAECGLTRGPECGARVCRDVLMNGLGVPLVRGGCCCGAARA